jgi:RHS repeat-associated protein
MDYTAFGEEILVNVGQRTVAQGFNSNQTLRNKYALTERDQATGLDHTWFRKNENKAGRWTSPDPYNGSMSLGNPQSFNRYSYVENQPTNFVDPTGLNASSGGGSCWVSWTATGWYIGDVLVGITNFNMNVSCSGGSANAQTGGLPNRATINTILDQKGDNQKDTCREFLNKAFEALKKGRNIDNVYANIKDIYIDSRLGIRNPKTNEVVNGQARFDKNGNRTIALAPYRGTGGQDASDGFYARNIFHELMHHAANSGTFTHDQMANAVTQATGIKKPDGIKSTTFVSQQINAHCPNAVSTKPK